MEIYCFKNHKDEHNVGVAAFHKYVKGGSENVTEAWFFFVDIALFDLINQIRLQILESNHVRYKYLIAQLEKGLLRKFQQFNTAISSDP